MRGVRKTLTTLRAALGGSGWKSDVPKRAEPRRKNRLSSLCRGWFVAEAEQGPAKTNPFPYALKSRAFIRRRAGL